MDCEIKRFWKAFLRRTTSFVVFAGLLVLAGGAEASTASPPGLPDSATGKPPTAAVLDPGFGSGGIVRIPIGEAFGEVEDAYGAEAGNGSLLVSDGAFLRILNDGGGSGEAFGSVGSLVPPPFPGREFIPRDLTIDGQGRLIVVGSSYYAEARSAGTPRKGGSSAFLPAALRILRYLPDGDLDPSFGAEGVVETDLGLPAPAGDAAPGRPGAVGEKRFGDHPVVRPTGVAVGSRGEIVVTGDSVTRVGRTCTHHSYKPGVVKAGFVARFAEDGAPDPTFGNGDLAGGRHLGELPLGGEVVEEPVLGLDGVITYRSTVRYACDSRVSHLGVGQLTPTGQARRVFGKSGASFGRYGAIAGSPDGSVIALLPNRGRRSLALPGQVIKFTSAGKPDRSFGTDGHGNIRIAGGPAINSLAVDGRGRVLVGGTLGIRKRRSMLLLRLSSAGRQEVDFGPHGRVASRVPGVGFPSALFFDGQGRLVTVHPIAEVTADHAGLVIARYLLRD